MFQKFSSLTRFSHGWTVTEKLDGTNACVIVVPFDDWQADTNVLGEATCWRIPPANHIDVVDLGNSGGVFAVMAQSRSKIITPGKATDNYGFAQFVKDNAEHLAATLGAGHHFGEWVGKGVNKRGYGLDEKVFALFNAARWSGVNLPNRVRTVPVLADGYMGEPGTDFARIMEDLKINGSRFAPGFMEPEGIVMRHGPSGTLFKKTFDYDEQGKWAENQMRKVTE